MSFNKHDPIILVGDERSGVNSFKLSNILFKGPAEAEDEKDANMSVQDLEIRKLAKFLDSQDKVVY